MPPVSEAPHPQAPDAAAGDADHRIADLLAQVAAGSRPAFAQLYQATCARFLGLAIRMLGDRQLAEDVLQEVYLTIWQKAPGFQADCGSAMGWLTTIVRHRVIDRLRSLRTVRSATQTAVEDIEDLPEPAGATAESGIVLTRTILRCLEQLKDRQRKMILLAFYQGFTYEELARRSGTPLGTVKSDIRRGLASLRGCLER